MSVYRRRPQTVRALQWWRHGDHPAVVHSPATTPSYGWLPDGGLARRAGTVVAPGDWIIEHDDGRREVLAEGDFARLYEAVPDSEG